MNYIIANPSKKLYIRLGESGTPETCNKQAAQRFEYSKAMNISEHLPKTLRKFRFKVVPAPEDIIHKTTKPEDIKKEKAKENITVTSQKEVLVSTYYTVSDSVTKWVERVRTCNDLAKDAAKRKKELEQWLSNVDKNLSNRLHEIELTKWQSGSDGYKEYKSVKIILEKRRAIKDELSVVQSILSCNLESMATDRIEKVVNGLSNRVFNVREVENYDDL